MLKLLLLIALLIPALSTAESLTLFINHDDGGKTSQRHMANFLKALQTAGCHAVTQNDANQPAQLIFDPTPRSHAASNHPNHQLIAIAKTLNGDTHIRGAIVVQASTGINDLGPLQGKWIAFINKHSWSGYRLPLKLLNDANINEGNSHFYFVGNHIGSVAALNHRDVEVAIIAEPLAKRWMEQNGLSIVAVTEAVETGGWWIHNSVSSDIKSQCTQALTQLSKSQHKVFPAWIDGFEAVN